MVYSSTVQMKFPRKKQSIVLTTESAVSDDRYERGKAGCSKNVGNGPVNWNIDRKNRYAVMGAHTIGMTYHSVRVHICVDKINEQKVLCEAI